AWKWGSTIAKFEPSSLHFFDSGRVTRNPKEFVHGKDNLEDLWMDYFLLIELAHVKELGYATGPLLSWFAPVLTEQFTQPPPYDPRLIAAYNSPTDTGPGTPLLKSWREVYDEYTPETRETTISQFGVHSYYAHLATGAAAKINDARDHDRSGQRIGPAQLVVVLGIPVNPNRVAEEENENRAEDQGPRDTMFTKNLEITAVKGSGVLLDGFVGLSLLGI